MSTGKAIRIVSVVGAVIGAGAISYAITASHVGGSKHRATAEPAPATAARESAVPTRTVHDVPAPAHGGTVVQLCDGETSVEVDGEMTPDKARGVSTALMQEWRAKNPNAYWDDDAILLAQATPQGGGGAPAAPGKQGPSGAPMTHQKRQGDVGEFSPRDQKLWAAETARFIAEGDKIFHDAKALGGTVAISCDMCHPNAANTHPETYPKFQTQFGRVALLRDMINWCIENPVKGKPMADGDPKLRALEAYILAQRKGVPLEYGKH